MQWSKDVLRTKSNKVARIVFDRHVLLGRKLQ